VGLFLLSDDDLVLVPAGFASGLKAGSQLDELESAVVITQQEQPHRRTRWPLEMTSKLTNALSDSVNATLVHLSPEAKPAGTSTRFVTNGTATNWN
jgi:hypothetical protein